MYFKHFVTLTNSYLGTNYDKPAFWVPKSCLGGKIWDFTLSDRTRANGTTYLVNCFKPCITVLQLLA